MKRLLLLVVTILALYGCRESDKDTMEVKLAAHLDFPFTDNAQPTGVNWINGALVEFNDNGGWSWYQDERVLVDLDNQKLIIGSVASGRERSRQVEVTHWDLAANTGERYVLGKVPYTDDHDAPAIIQRPDGNYAAMWATHNDSCESYYSIFDGVSWTRPANRFDWSAHGCPTPYPTSIKITYANLWYMGDTLYSFVRSIETSPNYLYSTDNGATFQKGGRLTASQQVGYVAGYYKYWGNNKDRIDWLGTEAHPRNKDNSLWHGYLQISGNKIKIYNSYGEVVDGDATDGAAEDVSLFTRVLATGTTINGVTISHLWNADLVRYNDGTLAVISSGRVSGKGSDDPDKRLLYHRFDGRQWKTTYLVKAGTKLYDQEEDYTGLGALDPDNSHVIYVSTPYDPRTDEGDFYGKKEIWKGVTCDDGATFAWEPVTANSDVDNIRPVVPKWNTSETALLWLRGTYAKAQEYDLKVVGIFDRVAEDAQAVAKLTHPCE